MNTGGHPPDARPSFQLSWRWYVFMSAMIFVPAILGLAAIWGLGRLRDSAEYKLTHPARRLSTRIGKKIDAPPASYLCNLQ